MKQKQSGERTSSRGGSVSLPKRIDGPLTITTCSYSDEELKPAAKRTRFLAGLRAAAGKPADLIVAAGYSQAAPIGTGQLLGASGGIPVLYETYERRRVIWRVAVNARRQQVVLRSGQLIHVASDKSKNPAAYRQLLARLAAEHGVIRFDGVEHALVLLICGENNVLSPGTGSSALVSRPTAPPPVVTKPWVVLNPAHGAYARTGGGSALVKVARCANGNGPMFPRVVAPSKAYADGTVAPSAIVHCNNFRASSDDVGRRTRGNASFLFERGRRTGRNIGRAGHKSAEFLTSTWELEVA